MARTIAEYAGPTGNQTFTEKSSRETVHAMAPLVFQDDFFSFHEAGSGGPWDVVEVALNTAIALVADGPGGQLALILDSDVNAQDAVLYWSDARAINVKKNAVIEFRARISVLPTLTAQIVMGLAHDHNLVKDSVVSHAWFKLDGNGDVVVETDDTTNDNDDVATGTTVATGDWHIFRIEIDENLKARFFIDGAEVAPATDFDLSNLTDDEAVMQPYFSLDKGADAGVGTLLLDYVKVWSNR